MSPRTRTRTIEREILSSSDAILDEIAERLGLSLVPTSSAGERELDMEVADLRGSVFDGLPARKIPLETFRVDAPVDLPPASRPRIDSFAPITAGDGSWFPPPPRAPERSRASQRAPWLLGCAVAAGLAAGVATGAMTRAGQDAEPAVAAASLGTPAEPAPLPAPVVLVQDPAPAAAPARMVAPKPMPAAAAPRPVPRPAVVAARGAAPVSSPAPAAAPAAVDAADLPPVLPAPAPRPAGVFDRASASAALSGAARAASCGDAAGGPVAVPVRVTFAPSGSATSASVTGGPLVGTRDGACMAAALRGARVPAFDGEPVAVTTVVHLR